MRHVVKQPNGKYALWSTVEDDFVYYDADADDIIGEFVAEAARKSMQNARQAIADADADDGSGWTSFLDCISTMRAQHGAEAADARRKQLTEPSNSLDTPAPEA